MTDTQPPPIPFDNSYARLPDVFYERIQPAHVTSPRCVRFNGPLAQELGLRLDENSDDLAAIFSGNTLPDGAEPLALAYAGHQFGGFVPQLGDGRAILLGEVVDRQGRRRDIQLKGSGRTRFSRNGDGRSALGPVVREYIVSEAMHALGIPTTRSLAMVTTGEPVARETMVPGGILTRTAASHIRVGTFEFFAARDDQPSIRLLADYVIDRHYPEARTAPNPYQTLFERVCDAQARLVAEWMRVGFIHGVMNTDNTTISGETIDYGPCAFMDTYDPATVFSSIDHFGRYAYENQPAIAQWNMASFGTCLMPLLHVDLARAQAIVEETVERFLSLFKQYWLDGMCRKLGLLRTEEAGVDLLKSLLQRMKQDRADFTVTFRALCDAVNDDPKDSAFKTLFVSEEQTEDWLTRWQARLADQAAPPETVSETMRTANPAFIPRNHRVEQAIRAAEDRNDFSVMDRLVQVLSAPYEDQPESAEYMNPPKPEEIVHQTFCGT